MADDTLADSVAQLNTLSNTLAARTSAAEQAAAVIVREAAARLQANQGRPSSSETASAAAIATGFGPNGAMAGWRE